MVASRRVGDRAERSSASKGEFLFQTHYGNPLNRDKLRENVIRPALRDAGLPEFSAPTTCGTRTLTTLT